jgi:invasion protein IalB
MAQEMAGQPNTIMETYDSWTVRCDAAKTTDVGHARQCQMSVDVLQGQPNQRALTLVLKPTTKGGGLAGTIIAPFGLKVSEGVTIKAGSKDLKKIAVLTCLPIGCLAQADFSADEVKVLGGQEKLVARVVAYDGDNSMDVDVPMKGFNAALARLGTLPSKSATAQ